LRRSRETEKKEEEEEKREKVRVDQFVRRPRQNRFVPFVLMTHNISHILWFNGGG